MIRLTDLLALPLLDGQGVTVGRLSDVVVRVADGSLPLVAGLVVQQQAGKRFLSTDRAGWPAVEPGRLRLSAGAPRLDLFVRRTQEILLAYDVLDHTVIDLRGPRVVRVNDILLEEGDSVRQVCGVDIGTGALLHRLLPRPLRRTPTPRLLRWEELELLSSELPDGVLTPDHRRLSNLHPADIARVADAVPMRQATEIVTSLDDELAADTMEEMVDERQADVVERLDPARAAHILECMAPDAVADVLAELDQGLVDAMLQRMAPAEAADAHALLTYPKDTAGGLMTTDYVIALPDLPVAETVAYLRPQLARPDWVYYVYVVADIRDRRLLGVFTLRDLLLAEPNRLLSSVMLRDVRRVNPETPARQVAKMMSDYNLLALPVTDAQGRLLGIVSVDDALEVILPQALRRRLPHIFR